MNDLVMDPRNPFLVLLWAFGLFMLMHGHQYIGALIAARADRVSFDALMGGKHESPRSELIRGVAAILVGIPMIWVCTTILWKRPLAWMGLGFQWDWLLWGLGMGLVAPVLIVLLLRSVGLARVSSTTRRGLHRSETSAAAFGLTMMAVFAGISEEIVFRGMMGLELSLVWGWPAAILVSGAAFGVVHLLGRLKELTARKAASVMISSVAVSFLFVSLYRFSGSLWLPIGFHIAWNGSHSVLLGLEMNGKAPLVSRLRTTLDTGSWIAGDDTGMEASVPSITLYVLLGLLFTLL